MKDFKRHLKLEEERLEVNNIATNAYMISSVSKYRHDTKIKEL